MCIYGCSHRLMQMSRGFVGGGTRVCIYGCSHRLMQMSRGFVGGES